MYEKKHKKLIASGILKEQKVKEIDSLLQNNNLSDKTRNELVKERNRLSKEAKYEQEKGNNDLNDINKDQKQYKENKRAKKDGLANIHVSIGSSKSRSESRLDSSKYAGGHIVSDNGIKLVTKPTTADSGDIVAIGGETIRGKSVELDASRNLSLQAGINTTTITNKYDSKGWSIGGANLSVNGGGLLGIDANYNNANENGTTVKTTHLGTVVQGNKVITNSGADTNIVGSKVYGDSIQSQIGGNLTIKSLQDSETYRGEKKNVGFSISTNGTQLSGVSAEYSKGKMSSDYASITEQAGLYAGSEGFDITTKGNTTLEGAVIDSKAKADKNKLSTNSLTVKDIKNKAEYKSSNTGLSYTSVSGFKNLSQAGKDAVYNSLAYYQNYCQIPKNQLKVLLNLLLLMVQ
ncbi:hemagglutinin repeat-containing protein [Veillonella rogosae]|uniref:hemagglutinin repeat-containing protein n=1 Tax=Veillonella rogosae TaxID=423477 RepID=UPI000A438C88|nr:hemagglutinin repeat-containing protein [Veillonella rogosae]